MLKYFLAVSAVVVSTVGLSHSVNASEESAAPAKLVVYRADEMIRSEWLSVTVKLDGQQIARLHAEDAVVKTVPAGKHVLRGSVSGTEPLVLDLKPGQTHYVYSDVDIHGNDVKVQFAEVEEQVVRIHRGGDEGAI
jgi:hypothetical protein